MADLSQLDMDRLCQYAVLERSVAAAGTFCVSTVVLVPLIGLYCFIQYLCILI